MAKRSKLFRAGDALKPFGSQFFAGLGEHMGNPERYTVEPTVRQVVKMPYQPGAPGEARSRKTKEVIREVVQKRKLQTIRTVPIVCRDILITQVQLGVAPERLDTGLDNRMDIMIMNMSGVTVWIDKDRSVAAPVVGIIGKGWPLARNASANGYNGGWLAVNASEEIAWWGVATAGAANLVLVVETGG